MTTNEISSAILAAMKAMRFLRYNIPEELANIIRPLSSTDAKILQNLHLEFKRGNWTDEDTEALVSIKAKAELLAQQLEDLLLANDYTIGWSADDEKKVVRSKTPLGRRIIFTWQLPEYEEYDGGLLSQQSEEEFLANVMSGMYDDKYDKEYLSNMYVKRELHEGCDPDCGASVGDGHYFIDKDITSDEEESETNVSNLRIV